MINKARNLSFKARLYTVYMYKQVLEIYFPCIVLPKNKKDKKRQGGFGKSRTRGGLLMG